tara:strand:+ start:333 stop:947 length:615 start_codon:yes stop_codon:yes gene_type:complete
MKFPASFLERVEKAENQEDGLGTSIYMNPGEIDPKKPAEFAFLHKDPLCFFEVWGIHITSDKQKPFRFIEEPTDNEILKELGGEYQRAVNTYSDESPKPPRKPQLCMNWSVYDFDNKCVRALKIHQFTIQQQIQSVSLNRKYRNLLDWNIELGKMVGAKTSYNLQVVPRDESTQEELETAWDKAQDNGWDLNRLLENGDPSKAE